MQRNNDYSLPYFFSQCNYHLWGVKMFVGIFLLGFSQISVLKSYIS